MTLDSTCPIPAASVAFRNIGGRIVIVDPRENKMISLNETGSFIWENLDGRDANSVASEVEKKFEISFEKAVADVNEFVTELEKKGLIVRDGKKGESADQT